MKNYQKIFLLIFIFIFLLQLFYWLFANLAVPIVMGMPFAMFFIVGTIILEFIALLALYFIDKREGSRRK